MGDEEKQDVLFSERRSSAQDERCVFDGRELSCQAQRRAVVVRGGRELR